ncbi:MAG TPA: HlyD family secretion protein [Aliidongia sp.]|uniref:HlyD family secretion protein n=1 Tax=Aliidongia sp. TaxID=1914230 RepID=UPI002DDCAF52|nr:HlyD family secretion protein [Aliidongia sp.]HEV2678057.1 HlyD family secretion protein [Aliidongia sp.]
MVDDGAVGTRAGISRAPAKSPTRFVRPVLLVLGPVVAVVAAVTLYLMGGRYVSIDNAYVQVDKVAVATDVSGLVASVEVAEHETVKAGQVLFRLDDRPFRIAVERAAAGLLSARNELESLKAGYQQKQDEIQLLQADLTFFDREFKRQADLSAHGAATAQQFDLSQHQADTARRKLAASQHELAALGAELSGQPDLPIERQPRYLAAKAMLDTAQYDLDRTVVKAPDNGVVANVSTLRPGQYLAAGTPGFSLIETDRIWITANPKETELTYVHRDQPVDITVDTYPGVTWHGTVESVSPASAAEFSMLPAQNSSGNWVKVVQRIPMRVKIVHQDGQPTLRAGMSVVTDIDTGHRRHLADLFSGLF